ncbi:hypothetical protein [Longispora albida]|uniref:hypothetical protein n=1 Tax=Longispora albida TaxID=203523 RepID=UPI00037FF8EC|nr:hypothetical protein [Longispora albida]
MFKEDHTVVYQYPCPTCRAPVTLGAPAPDRLVVRLPRAALPADPASITLATVINAVIDHTRGLDVPHAVSLADACYTPGPAAFVLPPDSAVLDAGFAAADRVDVERFTAVVAGTEPALPLIAYLAAGRRHGYHTGTAEISEAVARYAGQPRIRALVADGCPHHDAEPAFPLAGVDLDALQAGPEHWRAFQIGYGRFGDITVTGTRQVSRPVLPGDRSGWLLAAYHRHFDDARWLLDGDLEPTIALAFTAAPSAPTRFTWPAPSRAATPATPHRSEQ